MKRKYEITEVDPFSDMGVRNFEVKDPAYHYPVSVSYYVRNPPWAACNGCNSPLRGASGSCVHAQAVMRFMAGPRVKKAKAAPEPPLPPRPSRMDRLRAQNEAYAAVLAELARLAAAEAPFVVNLDTIQRLMRTIPSLEA